MHTNPIFIGDSGESGSYAAYTPTTSINSVVITVMNGIRGDYKVPIVHQMLQHMTKFDLILLSNLEISKRVRTA